MRTLNERLQMMQDDQAARQEDLQKGRIRIERQKEEAAVANERDRELQQQTA